METLPHQHQNSWLESDFYQMLLFQKFRLQQGLETRKGGGNERLKSKRCFLLLQSFLMEDTPLKRERSTGMGSLTSGIVLRRFPRGKKEFSTLP